MRLSKIKLSGFKSFVDPTTIAFPGNLMGIVGPNGCGKSNIIDAIRWVLGEGSAKTLRGDSMADVIFNGSSSRKPVGRASIELTFDNSDGALAGAYAGYSEVGIRRVVSRDGMSQYYLNNTRCRRKDITQILLGTGLGSNGYSIIEQGTISRLVEAKPDDMRAFLEEAAGISKYKERRRETEHRIRHTRDNLDRLNDLREELEKQLDHLQRQARAASRYKDLKTKQRKIKAELLVLRILELEAEVNGEESRRNQKQLAHDAALTEQRSTESRIEDLRIKHAQSSDDFNEIQGKYYKVGAEIARLEQSIQHRKELNQRQTEDLESTDIQLNEIQSHVDSDTLAIEEIDLLLQELNPELEQARLDHKDSLKTLNEAEDVAERWQDNWQMVADELARLERIEQVETANIEHLESQKIRLAHENESILSERLGLGINKTEERLHGLVAEEERFLLASQEAARVLDSIWEELNSVQEKQRSYSSELDIVSGKLHSDGGRLTSLEALQEVALGSGSKQISKWLVSRNLSVKSRLAQNLIVDPGWERAVETVLGGYLQAICVDSIGSLIESLSEVTDQGVILLDQHDSQDFGIENEDKKLSRYVQGVGVARLLSDVFVADSISDAISIREKLCPHESVITSEGVWMGPSWLRINGTDDPQVGVLHRGEEIKKLGTSIEKGSIQQKEMQKSLQEIRVRLESLEAERVKAQEEVSRKQESYSQIKSNIDTTRLTLEQSMLRATKLDNRLSEINHEIESLSSDLSRSKNERVKAGDLKDKLSSKKADLEESKEIYKKQVEEARIKTEKQRDRAQEIAVKVESRKSSKESASAALERVKNQKESMIKRRDELRLQLRGVVNPITSEAQTLEAKLQERVNVEALLSDSRKSVEEVDAQLRETDQLRSDQEQFVQVARESLDSVRLEVREIQVRVEAVSEQLSESGYDKDKVLSDLDDDADLADWEKSAEKLERQIQRLGAINLAAIDEFKDQTERKEYLDSQSNDLTQALETLENAIRKIDRETRARFKETFDAANKGLGTLFPRLYGGGHAYLELEGEDLLSSGVTIMARPPGKRNSTIHLLSGGEKALTAVALIFSIFELNPAPFCLLDEVDAPLDDANVSRFSEIVKEMSQQVQFVLITHNKTTMEAMHQLTGVTMNEPGVSRLVAVDIEEAVQLATM